MLRDERFYAHSYVLPIQRAIWEYTVRRTSALYPVARRDPIFTPIFTSILTGAGFSAGAAATGATIASAIATTALSIGIQMLMAPKPPKPEEAKFPLRQAIPYRIWGVGRARVSGAYMLWESTGHRLFAVQAIAGHRIKGFNRYWLHDDEVTVDGDGWVNGIGDRYAGQSVQILTRVGLATETAYAPAVAEFGAEGLWTNNHRGDGQASVMMFAGATRQKDQNKRFPYGVPSLSVEADLAYCWDFRDPDQSPTNPSTWTWTRNSAIICAWHLCFNEFGFGLDYTKAILPVLDLWKEEADICDEDVPLKGGGTEKRYECNGFDTTENSPKSGLNAILSTCDGHLVARGDGARILTVGKFRESRCATLTDADIIGHQIQYDVLFEDEINRLVPKFTYPETDYTTSDTDFFEDTAAQLKAGRVLSQDANYQWCHRWRQARRLGKRDWLRLQQKVRGSIDVRLSGINAVHARWVRLVTPNRMPRLNGKLVENRRSVIALTRGGFSMDIVQHPFLIDAWNPEVDEGNQPPVPPSPNAADVITPVINLVQAKPRGNSVYVRVLVVDPEDPSLTPVVRYRLADSGIGSPGVIVPGAWVEQSFPDATPSGGFIDMNTNTVPLDEDLDIQAAFKSASGTVGEWSITTTVSSTVDTDSPGPVTLPSAVGGVGSATFSWTAPAADNYAGAVLYWNTTNTITGAVKVLPAEFGAPGATDSRLVTGISAGTRYGFIRAMNPSGVVSTAAATGAFTVS